MRVALSSLAYYTFVESFLSRQKRKKKNKKKQMAAKIEGEGKRQTFVIQGHLRSCYRIILDSLSTETFAKPHRKDKAHDQEVCQRVHCTFIA